MKIILQSRLLQEKSNISFLKNAETPSLNRFYLFAQNWSNENFLGKIWLPVAWFLALKRSPFMLKSEKSDQPILKQAVNR